MSVFMDVHFKVNDYSIIFLFTVWSQGGKSWSYIWVKSTLLYVGFPYLGKNCGQSGNKALRTITVLYII